MKKTFALLAIALLSIPQTIFAGPADLFAVTKNTGKFVGNTIFKFLIALAFLVFVYKVIKFFIIESDSTDSKSKAKTHVIYSVMAIVFLVIFWGLTNLLVDSIGLEKGDAVQPDYLGY